MKRLAISAASAALCALLALPAAAQSSRTRPLGVTVGLGAFYPGISDNDRHSFTTIAYRPGFKNGTVLSTASIYLDTLRHKTTTGTGTSAVTKRSATQGLGLSISGNLLTRNWDGHLYQTVGVGLYERRYNNGTSETKGYAPGAKFGIGYRINDVFVETTYQAIGRIKGNDPSGLGLYVGVRF